MADLVDGIRSEFGRRNKRLRPLVGEVERLRRAVAALARTGSRPLPGVGSRAPAATRTARPRADSSAGAKPADREASRKRRAVTARRARAPRGQTQAKVLAALCAAPGSTTASVAEATGISASTVGATIARLVRQERVQRLQEGGYAPAEPPAKPAATSATDDTPSAHAPATTPAGSGRGEV
jgi:Winged helix-turn-helix DNA-binding